MLSRLRRNLNRRGESLDLQTTHIRSSEKAVPNHKIMDKENMATPRTTIPRRNPIRVMRGGRRTHESGVSTIKYLGTKSKNVAPRSH